MKTLILGTLMAATLCVSAGSAVFAQSTELHNDSATSQAGVSLSLDERYSNASWTYPDTAYMSELFPVKAIDERVDGDTTIDCLVMATGTLDTCTIVNETPAGYGFGSTMIKAFMRRCHVDPATVEGGIQPGDHKKLTYHWASHP